MRWNQKRTPELVAAAEQMLASGMCVTRVAESIGVTTSTIRNWLNPETNERNKSAHRKYLKSNRHKIREWFNARSRRKDGWAAIAACRFRVRAKKLGLPFSITADDVLNAMPKDGRCPVFGTTLVYGGKAGPDSASLDRIIPSLGYIPGNIAIISFRANTIKNDATLEELCMVADYLGRLSNPVLSLVS